MLFAIPAVAATCSSGAESAAGTGAAFAVLLDAPGHVCLEGRAVTASGGKPGTQWALLDWRGRDTGVTGVFDDGGASPLPPLGSGYYRMVVEQAATGADARSILASLAVVSENDGPLQGPDSFYGIDSAQSWAASPERFLCPWNGGDTFRTVSDLVQLAGFRHVRDRLRWTEVERTPGGLDYGKYMRNAELLHERGMDVSGMFHDCPPWAGRARKLPTDLCVVYSFCARLASDFGGRMGDWEFWNEPDKGFAPEPVWDYAAALKAAYLGFKAGAPGMTVLHGAVCQPPDGDYIRALYDNDAAKFSDAVNYHTYNPPSSYRSMFGRMRRFLQDCGAEGRPIWITESGTNQEGLSTRPGAMPEFMAHSPEQELVVAEFYPKSQIAFQMTGVSRNYFYTFSPTSERAGKKDWGVMRRDGTVKPVFSAMATMLRETARASLAGQIRTESGLRAYLFDRPDGLQTMVFWAESKVDNSGGADARQDPSREMRIELSPSKSPSDGESGETDCFRLVDMCGVEGVVARQSDETKLLLRASRYPSYLTGRFGLKADVQPIPVGVLHPYVPSPDEDLTVVVRAELAPEDFEITNRKTHAMLKGKSGRIRLVVWNLGDGPKTGRLEVEGGSLTGLPESISLGCRGAPPAVCDVAYEPPQGADSSVLFSVHGVFDGKRSSRLAIPMIPSDLFANCVSVPLDWKNPARWNRNTSADTWSVGWDDAEKAIRFHVSWKDSFSDRWFFPVLPLRLPEESLDGAVAVRFSVKSAQDKVENDFNTSLFMIVDRNGSDSFVDFPEPADEWEPRFAFLGANSNLGGATAIRIGGNPRGNVLTYWIRDVEILKSTQRDGQSPDNAK